MDWPQQRSRNPAGLRGPATQTATPVLASKHPESVRAVPAGALAQSEHNSTQLFTEIREDGFPGNPILVRQRLARWRVRPVQPEGASGTASSRSQPKRFFAPRHAL